MVEPFTLVGVELSSIRHVLSEVVLDPLPYTKIESCNRSAEACVSDN